MRIESKWFRKASTDLDGKTYVVIREDNVEVNKAEGWFGLHTQVINKIEGFSEPIYMLKTEMYCPVFMGRIVDEDEKKMVRVNDDEYRKAIDVMWQVEDNCWKRTRGAFEFTSPFLFIGAVGLFFYIILSLLQ
ncbi:hypothetical protein [Bacillus cereus]|uniref:hypothetical protein n=1 Tax=Bacillus cereus TaxID=1396 RepID=UPI000BFDBED3|nr:hypothetical protein [Bacillus cereus]PGR83630.1 hypothetical protein COC63_06490 [Bacillus cereus]